jgi:predicted glycosyltransferase
MGLGHLRRNLLIANALATSPLHATNLLISGAVEANFFQLPERADCLTLPRIRKNGGGEYAAGQLDVSLDDIAKLRAHSICSALEMFRPELFIVDKVPLGALGELRVVLEMLKRRGGTKCILGIRDVLDEPQRVSQEFLGAETVRAIERYYDQVWIYGDRHVYDPITEYGMPATVARRCRFTGYFHQGARIESVEARTERMLDIVNSQRPLFACLVGGGQDGAAVARAFSQAIPTRGATGVVVTGPFMPAAERAELQDIAAHRRNLLVYEFLPEADQLIARADRIVAMAGYNTVCSLLSLRKDAMLVPRVFPRREQHIRAERLKSLGFVDMMHPNDLSPERLRQWLLSPVDRREPRGEVIDFGGLDRLVSLTQDLISSSETSARDGVLSGNI